MSSSKRVKRDTVDLVTPDRATDHRNGTNVATAAAETERLQKEVTHKNEVITALEEFVGKMQKGLCCGICTELLYQPFNLACGHVFCYSCLVDWFKEAKRCPTCRERIVDKPAVSYLIKEMVNAFVRRAEIVDPEGTGARHHKEQTEADTAVREANGNLFPGLFFKAPHPTNRIADQADGVMRCIRCNWEVEGPTCMHCGLTFSDEEDLDFSDLENGVDDSEDDDDDDDDDEEDPDDYSSDEDHDIDAHLDAQYAAMEALSHYIYDSEMNTEEEESDEMDDDDDADEHNLWETGHAFSSEEHDDDSDDDDDDSDDDEDDSVMGISEPHDTENDSDDSIPYHTHANNYYNRMDSSTAQEDDSDDDDDQEPDQQIEIPRRSRSFFVVKSPDAEEEDSDDTARETRSQPQTRSMRSRGRNNIVDSDED